MNTQTNHNNPPVTTLQMTPRRSSETPSTTPPQLMPDGFSVQHQAAAVCRQ